MRGVADFAASPDSSRSDSGPLGLEHEAGSTHAAQFSCTPARSRFAAGDRHTYAPTKITQVPSLSFCPFISREPRPHQFTSANSRFPSRIHAKSIAFDSDKRVNVFTAKTNADCAKVAEAKRVVFLKRESKVIAKRKILVISPDQFQCF